MKKADAVKKLDFCKGNDTVIIWKVTTRHEELVLESFFFSMADAKRHANGDMDKVSCDMVHTNTDYLEG